MPDPNATYAAVSCPLNAVNAMSQSRYQWDRRKCPFSEVSLFQGLIACKSILRREKVLLIERCPHFGDVLLEGFC